MIGIDLIEIERIAELFSKDDAIIKIFTDKEAAYCKKYRDCFTHFAGRWAAKEAIAKALGIGFGKELSFLDIEILPDHSGKPICHPSSKLLHLIGDSQIELSITHCKNYAAAVALIK